MFHYLVLKGESIYLNKNKPTQTGHKSDKT